AVKDPSKIIILVSQKQFEWCYAKSTFLQRALQNFSGQISYHLPSHKSLQLGGTTEISLKPLNSRTPLKGVTVFTDRSGKTGKAIVTWKEENEWQKLEGFENGSPQVVELHAVAMAFQCFSDTSLNTVTNFAYVVDITQRLDRALLKEIDNAQLFSILKGLWHTTQARDCPYYILHVRSPTNPSGFIAEGNAQADRLASPACTAPQPDVLAQAKALYAFFHQGVQALQRQFTLSNSEVRIIVNSCS
ncbi:POK19 protein, partial [Oxylabes madagascariensis]|nr:POK19 protein [Oxylabes madagascariensis]